MEHTTLSAFPDSLGSAAAPLPGESLLHHSSFQDSFPALTSFQSQVDALVSSFLHQSTDAAALASLVAGGMAYRWGRIGVMSIGVQNVEPLRRVVSIGVGLGAEVMAFEFTSRGLLFLNPPNPPLTKGGFPNLWRWEGAGGIRQGLLTSLITFGSLKGAGRLAQGTNPIVQHLFQDSAMVLGHQTAGLFGVTPRPQGTLPEQFLHAEAVNLQMKGGLALLQRGLPQLESIEKGLDLTLRASSSRPEGSLPSFAGFQLAYTGRSVFGMFRDQKKWNGIYLSEGGSEGRGGSVEEGREAARDRLEKKYGAVLGAVYPPPLVSDAIFTALDLPPSLKPCQEEFLTAFSRLGDRDSLNVHLTLIAIREILLHNALHTSKGSSLDAWVQLFLTSALLDGDAGRRSFAFRALHETMKGGLDRSKVEDLLERFHYGEEYRMSENEASLMGNVIWTEFKKKQDDFEAQRRLSLALVAVEASSFPLIGLRRIDKILGAADHPSKLSELAAESEPRMNLEGFLPSEDPLNLAKKISGTYHTAFVDDIRLALTTVEVLGKAYEYRFRSPLKISKNREELERRAREFFQSGEAFSPKKLMGFFTFQGEERFFQMRKDWEEGRFEIVVLPDGVFDEKARTNILSAVRKVGLLDPRRENGGPKIFIRDLSLDETKTEEGYWDTFLGLTSRLSALAHEAQRFRQMYPTVLSYGPIQFRPFNLMSADPHGRLASGMMASLEEYLWRLTAGLTRDWELADRMGGVMARIRNEVDSRDLRR